MRSQFTLLGSLFMIIVILLSSVGSLIMLVYYHDVLKIIVKPSNDLREKVYVHVLALYPSGLRDLGGHVLDFDEVGVDVIVLELSDLRRAWLNESKVNKRFAEPYLVITGYTKSGKIVATSITTTWSKLPCEIEITLKPLENTNVSKGKIKTKTIEHKNTSMKPLNGCRETRYLVDTYETTKKTIIAKISPDTKTWGTLDIFWYVGKKIGVRLNVFIESEWTPLGYISLSKDEGGYLSDEFSTGETYWVWMDVKYRYERWHVHANCDGTIIDYDEEYIYITDYYPSTINGGTNPPPDSQTPPVDTWEYKGKYTQISQSEPYYKITRATYGSGHIAIDALKFITLLKTLDKISSKAAQTASLIGLFIDINFVYEGIEAFYFSIRLYSDAGYSHEVYIGESTDIESVPMLYIVSTLTSS